MNITSIEPINSIFIRVDPTKDYQDENHPKRLTIEFSDGESRSVLAHMNELEISEEHGSLLYWANLFANVKTMVSILECTLEHLPEEKKKALEGFLERMQ